jgi:multimeric flavodoxin WrbA
MKKKILVVLGSPRKEGNSSILAAQAIKGARETGAQVTVFHLNEMAISPCQACNGCRLDPESDCVVQDDMQTLYPELRDSDALLIASPVYWFAASAQIKLFMDRCYALGTDRYKALKGKKIGIILTYGGDDAFDSGAVNAMRSFQDAFHYIGSEIVGMVHGTAFEAGEVRKNRDLMDRAYELGAKLAEGSKDPRSKGSTK